MSIKPKINRDANTVLRCNFGPTLEILTSIGDGLCYGQAQNGVNFDFQVQFDTIDDG